MMRVGIGYDLHRLEPGRKLIIGGMRIQHPTGLVGHSDADVLTHAIIDALLGAIALGDIGQHFPDTDPRFKDADSLELLHTTLKLVRGAGYQIVNIDTVVVAERPKLASYMPAIRQRLAEVMEIKVGQISVKATTNEGVDAEGREDAISARAIALLQATGTRESYMPGVTTSTH